MRIRRVRVSLALLLLWPLRLPSASAPALVLTNAAQPTTTTATGDQGGKLFGKTPDPAHTRHYYIAAEPQLWDYAPAGRDVICGKPLPPPVIAKRNGAKVRYIQYTDDTFTTKMLEEPRLGLLGPVLRGNVGDFLAVTFLNRGPVPLSMHPHGAKYDKDSEGSYYEPKPGAGAAVGPGARFTYIWQLDEASGPQPGEPSSKAWLYHSHVESDDEVDRGLIGFIIVTDPTRARPDGTPADVDREMASLFMIHDESGLSAAAKEAAEHGNTGAALPQLSWSQMQDELERGSRYAINGFIFGNTPGLEMNEGERVRWYVFGLGSERDFHSAHWHGLRVVEDSRRRTDVVELLPATMKVADMVADNPGTWLFHCHVAEHMTEGMFARVIVYPKGSTGVSRAPGRAFFGLPQSQQSLLINRAQAVLKPSADGTPSCEVLLEGRVAVFDAFSVFTQPVQFKIGGKTITFEPNRRGEATQREGKFRVTNASAYGVVYGGQMAFETTLSGAAWRDELVKLGMNPSAPASLPIPILISIGPARHTVTTPISVESR